ncbi:hypothetical protein JRI60_15320 [Archangium violaceum]|uniref:hypothetical protein n=1 Tax=Archangium violaceum TaxID=83451 RepID=UPI00194F58F3|nr:hypothetical protein [Archangium violaceum]QRO00293.1 hypothetical protein JRI60_15320 [Archangium violaceum]
MSIQRKTRAWRGWLYASLPPLFLYGPACAYALHQRLEAQRLQYDGHFFVSDVSRYVPLTQRLLLTWLIFSPVLLAVIFYRWGKYQRPALKSSSLLIGLPWLLCSLYLFVHCKYGVVGLMATVGHASSWATLAIGLAELMSVRSIVILGCMLLLGALIVALILDVAGVGLVPEPPGEPSGSRPEDAGTKRLGGLCLAGLVVNGVCASLASRTAFDLLAAVAQSGLATWDSTHDVLAERWSLLHLLRQATLAVALLSSCIWLIRGLRAPRTHPVSLVTRGFVLAIIVSAHGVDRMAERFIFREAERSSGIAGDDAHVATLIQAEVPNLRYVPPPALIAHPDGLSSPHGPRVAWSEGTEALARVLDAQQRHMTFFALSGQATPPPWIPVALQEGLPVPALTALVSAARHIGLESLALVVGPGHQPPASTKAALRRVGPEVAILFSAALPTVTLRVGNQGCGTSSPEKERWIELGPRRSLSPRVGTDRPEAGTDMGGVAFWRDNRTQCFRIWMKEGAEVPDLMWLLGLAGSDGKVFLELEADAQARGE